MSRPRRRRLQNFREMLFKTGFEPQSVPRSSARCKRSCLADGSLRTGRFVGGSWLDRYRNGPEFVSSSRRNNSAGSSMIGSRRTLWPTPLMRTRSPSKPTSRGSRAARQRPFRKSLAISVLAMAVSNLHSVYTIDIYPCETDLVPQRLPRLQGVLNSLLRLFLAAKRFEPLALEIQDVLLAHRRSRRNLPAAEDFGDLAA